MARRRLTYKKMFVLTGVMLAFVLLVMVREQVEEMQLANWARTTGILWPGSLFPFWMGTWLSIFPVIEAIDAQAVAGLLIFGSYAAVLILGGVAPLEKVSSRLSNAASSMAMTLRLSLLRGLAFLPSQDLLRIIFFPLRSS
jgi:hypothetical protein